MRYISMSLYAIILPGSFWTYVSNWHTSGAGSMREHVLSFSFFSLLKCIFNFLGLIHECHGKLFPVILCFATSLYDSMRVLVASACVIHLTLAYLTNNFTEISWIFCANPQMVWCNYSFEIKIFFHAFPFLSNNRDIFKIRHERHVFILIPTICQCDSCVYARVSVLVRDLGSDESKTLSMETGDTWRSRMTQIFFSSTARYAPASTTCRCLSTYLPVSAPKAYWRSAVHPTDYGLGSYTLLEAVCYIAYAIIAIVLCNFMTRVGEGAIHDMVRATDASSCIDSSESGYARVRTCDEHTHHMIDFSFMPHVRTRVRANVVSCFNGLDNYLQALAKVVF